MSAVSIMTYLIHTRLGVFAVDRYVLAVGIRSIFGGHITATQRGA